MVRAGRLRLLTLLATAAVQCDASQMVFMRSYDRDSFARVSIPWSEDTRSARIEVFRFGENSEEPVGTAELFLNVQEPASPSRSIYQAKLDDNLALRASTIPAGVVEIYIQGPLPPNSFKGFGSGEQVDSEGVVVTVYFDNCALPNLAGFCSLPMQTVATATHLLPSRHAENTSTDAASSIAEDGGTTILALREGDPVVVRIPLPLGARSLSLSLVSLSDAVPSGNSTPTLAAFWTENRAIVVNKDTPAATLAAVEGANTSLSRTPPAPGAGFLTIALRGANLTRNPTHRVSVRATVHSCDQASIWMGTEKVCAAALGLMNREGDSPDRTNSYTFAYTGILPTAATAATGRQGVPPGAFFAVHRFDLPTAAAYFPGRLALTMQDESAMRGMVVGIRRALPPSPSMRDAAFVLHGDSPDEQTASFHGTQLLWYLPNLGQGEWFIAVGPASGSAERRLEGDSPSLHAYVAGSPRVEEEAFAPESRQSRLYAARREHALHRRAMAADTRARSTPPPPPPPPLESAMLPRARSRLRGAEDEGEAGNATLFYRISLRLTPCTDRTCKPQQGRCALIADGMHLMGACHCGYRWEGADCGKKALSDTTYGLHVSLLLVSNFAIVPAVVAAYRRQLYGEMVVFASLLVSSFIYHACDTDYFCLFGWPFSMLQVADYTFAVTSAVVVVAWYSAWPTHQQHFKYGPVVVFGAWNAVAVAGSNSFAIPAILIGGGSLAVFVADILFSIWRHTKRKPTTRAYWSAVAKFVKQEDNFAPKPIAAGLVLVVGAVLCVAFQNRRTYFALHSVWHVCIMVAAFAFLLGRRRWSEYHYPAAPVFRRVALEPRHDTGWPRGGARDAAVAPDGEGREGEGRGGSTGPAFRAMAP